MTNILIKKIKNELTDVYGVSSIGFSKKSIFVYVFNEFYKEMIKNLLNEKLNNNEMDQIQIIVTGKIIPAVD